MKARAPGTIGLPPDGALEGKYAGVPPDLSFAVKYAASFGVLNPRAGTDAEPV